MLEPTPCIRAVYQPRIQGQRVVHSRYVCVVCVVCVVVCVRLIVCVQMDEKNNNVNNTHKTHSQNESECFHSNDNNNYDNNKN